MAKRKTKASATEIKPKSKAEQICAGVPDSIREQTVTLANAVFTIQEKIEQQIPIYKQMPLAQQVKVGTGESMLRANPATQEFRAMVRDYAAALNSLNAVIENHAEPETVSSIEDLRAKFKVG